MDETEKPGRSPRLDRVIHERARLIVLAYLSSSEIPSVGFTELKEKLGLSAGNLSIQLKTLEGAGYVKIAKSFVDNRPNTTVSLTAKGSRALREYLREMEALMGTLKPRSGTGKKD
ncbi:MAG TPA: transcriptional regulator [Spirochaetia bacterium]|nr:transcriptional regulator [Spirochaetia bacterium]